MKVLVPATGGPANLLSTSGVPLSIYPAWSSSTSYVLGQRVSHTVGSITYDYEAIAAGSGTNPATDSQLTQPTRWIRMGLSNRFRVVDGVIGDKAISDPGANMVFVFQLGATITNAALFGIVGESVTISVQNSSGTTIAGTTQTIELGNTSSIRDWFDYFFAPVDTEGVGQEPDVLFENIQGFAGNLLRVQITGSGGTGIGEIVFGKELTIGTTQEGATIGLRDYSIKERDAFGRPIIVERPFSYYGEFDLVYPTPSTKTILKQLGAVRSIPCVFYTEDMEEGADVMIFGYYVDFSVNLQVGGESYSSLNVEGLI